MTGRPVVIAENGMGLAVRPVEKNAPVMTVAENGMGIPIVISDRGAPYIVEGLNPPVVWTPAELFAAGEMGVWYDPSDLTTMFQDAAGTVPVTADGQPVGMIRDKSGNGKHATQAATASRPVYRTDGARHWLQFDGVDDFLLINSLGLTETEELSLITGMTKAQDASARTLVELSVTVVGQAGSFALFAPGGATPSFWFTARGTASPSVVTVSPYPAPYTGVLTGLAKISANNRTVRVNGALAGSSSAGLGTGNFLDHKAWIGRREGKTFPFQGNLYGLLIRGKLTEGANLAKAEAWMADKTGVAI